MKKGLLVLFLTGLLLLVNSSILWGDDFSIGGSSFSDRYNFTLESYKYDPVNIYIDLFRYEEYDASYFTTILGVEYFLWQFSDYDGFYIGAGFPLFRDISENNPYMKNSLGPAYESGMEFRGGIRCRPLDDVPLFMGFEYSNIKKYSASVGVYF